MVKDKGGSFTPIFHQLRIFRSLRFKLSYTPVSAVDGPFYIGQFIN